MIDPDEIVEYNSRPMAIKDIPSAPVRWGFGYGHPPAPGRGVIPHPSGEPWPYEVETCPRADETQWIWINGGRHLVCPGCGADGT